MVGETMPEQGSFITRSAKELEIPGEELDRIIDVALAEDTGHGDITTKALIPAGLTGQASLLVKRAGVLAGIEVFKKVFQRIDTSLQVKVLIRDGSRVKRGDIIAIVSGRVSSILTGERVALNFIQRLSGVATLTARFVARVRGFMARIYDTRKTTPGLRMLEKYAVRMGGGKNHRLHLGDAILIKDNHIAAMRAPRIGLLQMVKLARQNAPRATVVEIEVTSAQEALEVVEAGADIIMLDNMSVDEMRRVAGLFAGKVKTEASGGITLSNVREVAATGVDIISIGALTHSPRALDMSLELELDSIRVK